MNENEKVKSPEICKCHMELEEIPASLLRQSEDEGIRDLFLLLQTLKIEVKTFKHKPVYTVEEASFLHDLISGIHLKNLFLRSGKKKNKKYFLVIFPANKQVNLKSLAKEMDSGSLSFASPEELKKILQVGVGHVTPFSLFYSTASEVKLFIDEDVGLCETQNYHPLCNHMTTSIETSALMKFLLHIDKRPKILK